MKKENRLILTFLFAFSCLSIISQTTYGDVKWKINAIKKDSRYIYADITAASEQDAHDLAEDALYQNVNEWAATSRKLRKSPNLVVNNRKELWTELSMPRGNMFRSFLYVKKSDIQGADNATVIENTGNSAQTSKVEELAVLVVPNSVQELSSIGRYADFVSRLKELKSEGKVTFYARYASLENANIYYLAIYDRNGEMKAFLTPGLNRRNIASGKIDDVTNYSGCGAIGFSVTDK